jgi:hypothetical protein
MLLLPRLWSARPDHGLQDASAESVGRTAEEGGKGMTKCNIHSCHNYAGNGLCKHNETDCTLKIKEEGSSFRGNQGQAIQANDLTRIADAMEKIARELERGNKLKALELRHKYEIDNDHIDEIMEE